MAKLTLSTIANAGMHVSFQRERARFQRERARQRLEEQERLRMIRLASTITTEAMLQQILQDVDAGEREAVEAAIRPHTKILLV